MATNTFAQRYVLEASLGHGGMGEVHRAHDTVEGRRVALKLLRASALDAERSLFQFKQEFRVALSLRHPHLVQVYDFGQADGAPYFTMELVEGLPLATGQTHGLEAACDVMVQVLLALELLHARGLLHRDVKPDNMRFTAAGELKLLDLGLLEAIGVQRGHLVSGTMAYLPPEALGARPLTPAADLYSVGVLAYELLAGRHPFEDVPRRELLDAIVHRAPTPLESAAPGVPAPLARVVTGLLAKDPAERPQRASEVIRAIAPYLAPHRIEAGRRQAHSYLLAPGLVGRQAELAAIMAAVSGLALGVGAAWLVGAHAGVGKTRLVQEVRLRCQLADTPFLTARSTSEGGRPYGVLEQLLRQLVAMAPEDVLTAHQALVGPLGTGAPASLAPGDKEAHHARVAAFMADVAASRPLVLFVDDLQWADTLSLAAIRHCLDAHRQAPILWLGTYRLGEVGARHMVRQALQEGQAVGLELTPFSPGETEQLVRAMLGAGEPPEGLLPVLQASTLGNGFFLAEMLRDLVDRGHLRLVDGTWRFQPPEAAAGLPDSLERLIAERLARLSAPAQALARFAAVLASDVAIADLDGAGLPEQALLDAIGDLLEHQVWVPAEDGYRFAHDRLREAIYQALPADERRAMHQRLGERLEARGASAATLAYHFGHGHALRRGVRYMRQAGLEAEAAGAMQEAFRHWRRAAELLEAHPEWNEQALLLSVWLDLGNKCGFSVDSRVGEEALDKAIAILSRLGRPELAARGMGLALGLIKRLPAPLAGPIMARLSRPVPFHLPTGWRRLLPPNYLALIPLLIESYTYWTICCNTNGKIGKALEVNRRGQRLVPDRDSWAWGVVMTAYAYSLVLEGRFDESVRIARAAFGLLEGETAMQAIDMSCGALVLANNQVYQGLPVVAALSDELLARATTHRMTEWEGMVQYAPMVHFALTGRARQAFDAIESAQPLSRRCGRGTVLEREIVLATARIRAVVGDHDGALQAIAGGLALDEVVALPYFTTRLYEVRGRVHLERGDLEAAGRDFALVIERETAYGIRFTLPEAHLGLSEVARRRGDLAEADAHWREAGAILDTPAFRCEIKRIYHERQAGRLAQAAGRFDDAEAAYERAIALADAQQNPWQGALVRTDRGLLAMRLGDEAAARRAWEHALVLYQEAENPHGQRQVRQLLGTLEPRPAAPEATPAQAHEHLAVLGRFAGAAAEARTVEEVLATLVTHAMDAIGGQRGAILRVRPHRVEVVLGREGGVTTVGHGPEVSHTVVREAMASDQAVLVADALADEAFAQQASVLDQAVRTLVCVPLDGAEGLALYADRPSLLDGGLDQGHLWVLQALVHFGRVALANARLLEQADARQERLQMLNQVSRLVSSSLELSQVLDRLLAWVLTLTGAEVAMVLATEGTLEVMGVRGDEAIGYSRSVVGRVAEDRQAVCVLDVDATPGMPESVQAMKVQSVMCVPLEVRDELLGVLYVASSVSARTFSEADLDLLRAIAANSAMAIHNARQLKQVHEKRAIENELSIAQRIQQSFYPERMPDLPGLRVSGVCQAAREVGGDFYDIVPLPDGRVALTLGDVSGKSVSAALYMAVARTALRMALGHARSPRDCLIEVNRRIAEDVKDGSFITCFLGIFDPRTRDFVYASAGHHLSFVVGAEGPAPMPSRGLPLGMDPDAFAHLIEERAVLLAPGDRVALFTDGVIEALSPAEEEFGEEQLLDTLRAGPRGAPVACVEAVIRAIGAHVADASPFDDMTLLVADVEASAAPLP